MYLRARFKEFSLFHDAITNNSKVTENSKVKFPFVFLNKHEQMGFVCGATLSVCVFSLYCANIFSSHWVIQYPNNKTAKDRGKLGEKQTEKVTKQFTKDSCRMVTMCVSEIVEQKKRGTTRCQMRREWDSTRNEKGGKDENKNENCFHQQHTRILFVFSVWGVKY